MSVGDREERLAIERDMNFVWKYLTLVQRARDVDGMHAVSIDLYLQGRLM